MSHWQLITNIGSVIAIVWFAIYLLMGVYRRHRDKAVQAQQAKAQRAERLRAALERAAREKAIQASVAAIEAKAQRVAAKRAAAEDAATKRAALERAAAEQAIAEWIAAEEAEARRATTVQLQAEDAEAEELQAKRDAAEQAIAEWTARMQAEVESQGVHWNLTVPATSKKTRKIDAVKEQVVAMVQQLDKEADELEFITNEIQTKVDFLPVEVQHTIEKWKKGQVYREDTLNDLKLKFRFQAYSIQDGWDMLYAYRDWIAQQHQKMRVFIRILGTPTDPSESLTTLIEKTEKAEWGKYLDMDMDTIFTLKQMQEILHKMTTLEPRLNALEDACRKRSTQIITPSWDPKGSL